ncbi:Peptidase M23 [Anaeromyxobacter sp. K]|uniref:murein hydrolase activator EnvC family protein n=1 Tax=Anaeromyxobacter sp. (strain K) TaxID=447217 RepID=UPI00015F8EB3|nr:peptidoglycan DD-metalloendopeptidase family protein [Anaeromyxobacter sp. K]ACG71941.1 Peptidase M23 [Anaeromyxobacter sp. K]
MVPSAPLGIALALALAAGGGPRAQLDALEVRRRAEEAAARMLAQQERSVLDTLAESEAALAAAAAEARRAEAARAGAEAALSQAREEEAAAQARMQARLAELRPRLAARERLGRTGELQVLSSSRSLADLVKRRWLMERILSHDVALLAEADAARDARERARAARQREAGRLAALAKEAAERREDAAALREERETLLAALRTARGFHERAAAEAVVQQRRLAEFVATLPPPRSGGALPEGFAARRGRLPLPVAGHVTVGFGKVVNPRFNTVTVQNGLDVDAPAGAPVRAVAPGRVVHAGWFKGYGNIVIVDHGDGYHTLVAHLASMRTAMGEDVPAGAVLGTVGDTGSLKGPYLYFELREKGRPVDPRPWLAP